MQLELTTAEVPYGCCHCGCGEKAPLAPQSDTRRGWTRGMPIRYIAGHKGRLSPVEYIEQDCGYDTPCWVWQRFVKGDGYGQKYNARLRRSDRAHRVYYEQHVGLIPEGLVIDHLCCNRRCVNPAHLEPVTQRENVLRSDGPAAQHARKTACHLGHPLSGDNIRIDPRGRRVCLTCERRRNRKAHKKAAATPAPASTGGTMNDLEQPA
jgi:hypothetical protein